MNDYLEYKGYVSKVNFSDDVYHCRVLGSKLLLSCEGNTIPELIEDYHDAIDEYLLDCITDGVTPERGIQPEVIQSIHAAV